MAESLCRDTGYWSDTIRYKELEGSAEETVSVVNTSSVSRKFLVDWPNRHSFANGLVGGTQKVGSALQVRTPPKADPDRQFLLCQTAKIAGFGAVSDAGNGVIAYDYAEITAEFMPPTRPEGQDSQSDDIVYFSEKWSVEKTLYPRPGYYVKWSEGSQIGKAVGEDSLVTHEAVEIKITIDVQKWWNPPLAEMVEAVNKINNKPFRLTFNTFPMHSLRFVGIDPSYDYTADQVEGVAPPFNISLTFAYNPNKWVNLFCPQDGVFRKVLNPDGSYIFDIYDFDTLLPAGRA